MIKQYNILIIEDHPLIIEAYKNALLNISSEDDKLKFNIDIANDCDTAFYKIEKAVIRKNIDIVFLDIKLPPSKDGKIISGEDLGIKIRALFSEVKIVVATTYNDNYIINTIFKSINPDAFLIKNDLNPKELILAIETIIKNLPYYSKTVIKLMRKLTVNDFFLDEFDRKILYELSKGSRMNELPRILPLSIAAIEKRKRFLKEIFNVENDRGLIKAAEEKGFI